MENADGYMVLNYKNRFKFRQKYKGFSLYLQYYCFMLVCSCIGILIFMITLICLNFWDKRMDFSQKVIISLLAGNNYLCSKDWLLNQEKCYMFSISSKTWNEKLEFIQRTLKPGSPGWIGLYVTSPGKWMWINQYPFCSNVYALSPSFLIIGPTDHKRCALITGNQVYSEDCNSKFNGICQRDAF
ncbi:killer cell lectin-like receptor subfamily F member 2 [Canis lupus baileyi]|uniref:killer cell lectin-like receptor subfamily F member 2 n=1 Tax=Canis lupus baileyi TaxID=143281 RepID=UPI0002256F36